MTTSPFPEDFYDPTNSRKKRKRRKTPKKDLEASVQRECLLWLNEQGVVKYIERRNTGAVQFSDGAFVRFGARGAADIFCLVLWWRTPRGGTLLMHVEIECKRRDGKGRLSPTQKAFKQRMDDIGVPHLVVTSAEDLAEQFRKLGLTD